LPLRGSMGRTRERRSSRGRAVAIVFVLLMVVLSAPRSAGGQFPWGGRGGRASGGDPANWNPNGLPNGGTTVTFGSGFASGTFITLPAVRAVQSLTINTTTSFTISASPIGGVFLLSGSLTRQDVGGTEADQ